jgi:predicted ATPase
MPATNLPIELNSFVGRRAELASIRALLANSRLLTITGPGGIGKTRLALHAAASILDRYADGVWLVDFSYADPCDSVLGAIRSMLPGPCDGNLIDHIGGREMLLVLDNCEHVVGECAYVTRSLLVACPHLRVLATSREVLGIAGERVMSVGPLSLPHNSESSPRRLRHSEAGRLFLTRVRTAMPSFLLTAELAAYVAEICCQLEGVPLAIELAAARVRGWGVSGVVSLVRDQSRMLNLCARGIDMPSRQRSLRASHDWSVVGLADTDRDLLRRLATLPGRWTIQDAEAACAETNMSRDVVDAALDNLIARSLIRVELRGMAAHYSLLNSLRQYALRQAEAAPPSTSLTPREQQVLALVARGHSNKQIGSQLAISDATARVHVEHILTKLDVRSRTQAAVWALHRGI